MNWRGPDLRRRKRWRKNLNVPRFFDRLFVAAGDQPGSARVTALLTGGESAVVDLYIEEAPRSEILVFANPSVLVAEQSSVITLIARDRDGFPLGAGERIRLIADLGTVEPDEVFTDPNGEAEAIFVAGTLPESARVTALLSGSSPSYVRLDILDSPAALFLTADPVLIFRSEAGVEIELRAFVLNARGTPFRDQLVIFESEAGELANFAVSTDHDGEASNTLTARAIDVQHIPEGGLFEVTATVVSPGRALQDFVYLTVLGAP